MFRYLFSIGLPALLLVACAGREDLPETEVDARAAEAEAPMYRIGPGDSLEVFVWRNEELSTGVTVRPDGRITMPLIEDMTAANKSPSELARDIEDELSVYVQDPLVTVMVGSFSGTFDQQVRVVGAATNPQAIPYRADMTLLDVMIQVGGLTEFAAGNSSKLVRVVDGEQKAFDVNLDSLIRDGRIESNAEVLPGDILIVPETFL